MTDEAILKATGRGLPGWFSEISSTGLADSSHKAIADFLAGFPEVSYWWAQTITVEYEKMIGRRVTGQTSEGSFQIGVSKTINSKPSRIWDFLESQDGIALMLGGSKGLSSESVYSSELVNLSLPDGTGPGGISAETTTYKPGSHFRMRFTVPGWATYSILQVRVESRGESSSVITFHQEKLPDASSRDAMRARWKRVSQDIARAVTISI